MPTTVSSLHSALPESELAPKWVQLLPGGHFSGKDGRGPYQMTDPEAVIAASMQDRPYGLVFDQDHATDHSLRDGKPAPARGWIKALQARDGAIWGEVDWTPEGRRMLENREYRGISPVFQHDKASGRVHRLLRASLTNAPNFDLAIHSQEPRPMDFLPAVRAALGLPDTADESAIVAAATAARTAVAAHAEQVAAIARAAKLDPAATADGIVTALAARQASPGAGTLEEVTALQTQVVAMQNQMAQERAEAAIARAVAAGKPILPARRAEFVARHIKDPAGTEAWLADMPTLHAGGVPSGPAPDSNGLDAVDAQVIALAGISPEAFLKTKLAIAKGVSA